MTDIEHSQTTQTSYPNADISAGAVQGTPNMILRCEGAVLLVVATAIYSALGGGLLLFLLLFLVPDVFMAGYLVNKRIGAAMYNIGHSTIGPVALAALGWLGQMRLLVLLGLIWLAHVGFDRLVGYGLKYADDFKHTHLGTPFAKRKAVS